jgi:hypothetical protein
MPGTGLSYVTKQVGGSRKRGSLLEELFVAIFVVCLLGALRAIWRGLVALGRGFSGGSRSELVSPPPTAPDDNAKPRDHNETSA